MATGQIVTLADKENGIKLPRTVADAVIINDGTGHTLSNRLSQITTSFATKQDIDNAIANLNLEASGLDYAIVAYNSTKYDYRFMKYDGTQNTLTNLTVSGLHNPLMLEMIPLIESVLNYIRTNMTPQLVQRTYVRERTIAISGKFEALVPNEQLNNGDLCILTIHPSLSVDSSFSITLNSDNSILVTYKGVDFGSLSIKVANSLIAESGHSLKLVKLYGKDEEIPTKMSQLTNDAGYVKTTEIHNHDNKEVLDGITAEKVTKWNSLTNDYNNLINTPAIPSIEGLSTKTYVDTQISRSLDGNTLKWLTQAEFDALPENDKNNPKIKYFITDKVEDRFSGDYNDLENLPELFSGNYADLQGAPTIPTKLSQLTNDINYATTSQLHSHSNKSILDSITQEKISAWDNKSNFSGDYNALSNKPITISTSDAPATGTANSIWIKIK